MGVLIFKRLEMRSRIREFPATSSLAAGRARSVPVFCEVGLYRQASRTQVGKNL